MEPQVWNLLSSAVTAVVSAVAGGAVAALRTARARDREDEERERRWRDEERSILRLLLLYRLRDLFRRYVVDGEPITSAEKREAEELYKLYHKDLNGNGDGTYMYTKLMELRIEG